MPTTVDERIVAAKFDAADFEKGVNKTLKKLDELKEKLNMKEATDSVKELAEKTKVSTDSMSKSLDTLTERFTNFAGMIKQKILSGLADEVANVFLRMEQSVVGFVKSISTDNISDGMNKYQQMLTSVRQMVNAGNDEAEVFKVLERTQQYADETSYSFEQMSDAMAQMVSGGVDLETAGKAVEGIANACANAGINANEARTAFYNLSQAYTHGSLEYTDYRSLELMNLTTEEFKEQMLEAAVAAGTLEKKTDKLGNTIYKTTNKKDKKVKANKTVNKQNLSEMLRYDWMNTDALNNLFGKEYWMEVIDKDELAKLRKELGDEEFEKRFGKIASQAYDAAYEARSFVDVVNALKDAVSSGWGKTFEYLFGRLTQARDFFTELANGPLAQVVYKIGEYRNAILGYWDAIPQDGGGGQTFRDTILNISSALGTLLKTFLQILPGFDELDNEEGDTQETLQLLGDQLFIFTMHVRDMAAQILDAAKAFNTFMNSPMMEGGPTRIEVLRQTIGNILSVFSIVGKVIEIAMRSFHKAFYVLSPILDGVSILLNKVTQPIKNLSENQSFFNNIEDLIKNILTILTPIASVVGKIVAFLGDIAAFFVQMSIDSAVANIGFFADVLGILMELLTGSSAQKERGLGVLDRLRQDFEGIKTACVEGLTAVKEFFAALLGDIKKLLGLTDATGGDDNQNGGVFSGIINFFNTNEFVQKAKNWVNQAIIDVGNFIKSIPSRIMQFGANIYQTLRSLFFEDKEVEEDGRKETKTVLTPLGQWLDGVIKDIKAFVLSIPDRIIAGVGAIGNWIDGLFNAWFGTEAADKAVQNGVTEESKVDNKIFAEFEKFVQETVTSIKKWFEDLPNKIQTAFKSIGDFATRLWNAIDEFLFGKKVGATKTVAGKNGRPQTVGFTTRYKTGFSKWLDGVIKDVKKFILKIPEFVTAGIKGAGDIISTIINALFGNDKGGEADNKTVEARLEKPFMGISLTGILAKIKEIGTEILNQIARIFTGSSDIETNQKWFSETIANGINWIREKADIALKWVLEFFSNLPTTIANLFKGENKKNEGENGPIGKAISDFGNTIGEFIAGIPGAVADFFNKAIDEFGNWWDNLYKAIIGEEENKKANEGVVPGDTANAEKKTKSKWDEFVEKLGGIISKAFEALPGWIAKGLHMAVIGVNNVIGQITEWIKGDNIAAEMAKASKEAQEAAAKGAGQVASDVGEATTEGAADAVDQEAGENALLTAIKGIGQTMYDMITITIPAFFKEGWAWVVRQGGEIWNAITGMFNGINSSDFSKTVNNLAENIKTAILNLPTTISNVFNTVAELIKNLFKKNEYDIGKNEEGYMRRLSNQERLAMEKANKESKNPIVEAFKTMFDGLFGENGALSGDVGQKILNFFTHTVPMWIGKAVRALFDQIPGIVASFSEGLSGKETNEANTVKQKAEQGQVIVSNISEAFSVILNKFSEMMGHGTLQDAAVAVVRLIAIIEVLKVVRDVIGALNVTGNMAEKEEAKNGFGAAVKRFMTAIIVAFGFVAFLSTLPDKKRKDAMEVIKQLTDMFSLLATLFTAGKIVGDIKDGVENVTETIEDTKVALSNNAKAAENLAEDAGKDKASAWSNLGDSLAGALTSIFGAIGITGAAEIVQYGIEDIVGSIIRIFEQLSNGLETVSTYISSTVAILLKIKKDIDDAIEVAGKAATLVNTLSKLSDYGEDINNINTLMPTLAGSISLFKNAVSGRWIKASEIASSIEALIGMTQKMREFAKFTDEEDFEKFKYGLASLGAALSMYTLEGVNNLGTGDGISKAVEILKDILGNDNLSGLAEQLKSENFPDARSMYGSTEKMVILAGAIASIANASAGISNDAGGNLKRLFDAVSGLQLPTDSQAVNTLSGQFGTLGNALGSFANDTQDITEDKLKSVKLAIDIMYELQQKLRGTGQGFLEKLFEGDESIQTFGTQLSIFGQKLSGFFTAIGGKSTEFDFNAHNIEIALKAIREISFAYRDLNEKELLFKTGWNNLGEGLTDFAENVKGFIDGVKDIELTDEQIRKVSRILDMVKLLADVAVTGTINGNDANRELGELALQMDVSNNKSLASAMINFYTSISKLTVADDIVTVFRSFADVMVALGDISAKGLSARSQRGIAFEKTIFDNITGAFLSFNENFEEMKTFFVNVKEFDREGITLAAELFKSLRDLSEALYYFYAGDVQKGLDNLKWFNWNILADILSNSMLDMFKVNRDKFIPVGEAIAPALFEGIQSAFDNPELGFQPKITPVLSLETAKQQIIDFFGTGTIEGFNLSEIAKSAFNSQPDEERVKWTDLKAEIAAVATAIKEGPENAVSVSDVTNAFANMKIVTDTGVLAAVMTPEIDRLIGNRIWLIQKGVTPQ